jgi:hypothetical protein
MLPSQMFFSTNRKLCYSKLNVQELLRLSSARPKLSKCIITETSYINIVRFYKSYGSMGTISMVA